VAAGILLAYFSNYVIGLMGFGNLEWRWKLGAGAVLAVPFFIMLLVIPESPRWLAKKARIKEAREVLRLTGEEDVEQDLRKIVESVDLKNTRESIFSRK